MLGVYESQLAAGSFVEETGEIWSPEGVLLVQLRQLAAILPAR